MLLLILQNKLFKNIIISYECINISLIFCLVTGLPDPVYCPNQCGRCYRGVKRIGNLNRHLRLGCVVPGKFQCGHCGQRFSLTNDLKKHCIRVHKIIP